MSGSLRPGDVLGISLGTRAVGLALFLEGSLADWRIKTFWKKWNKEKQDAIIKTILTRAKKYAITSLVIKSPTHGKTENLAYLLTALQKAAETEGIAVRCLSIHDLKSRYSEDYRAHRNLFFDKLLKEYPQLNSIKPGKKGRTIYHDKVFEAIECGQYALETGL